MGDHVSDPCSGMHSSQPAPDLRVKWASVRPHRAVAGAWVAVVAHLVVVGAALAASGPEDFWPVLVVLGAASLLTFGWLCACWRVDPDETTWDHEPSLSAPAAHRPLGALAGLRAGWRPLLAWLVGTAAVWGGPRGLEGLMIAGVVTVFLVPLAIAVGLLPWVLVVMPIRFAAAGVRRLRGEAGASDSPSHPVSHPAGPAPSPSVRSGDQPDLGVALVAYGVLALMVLPVGLSLHLSGAATSRYDAIPALLGLGGVEPTFPLLLWVARVGLGVIVLVGMLLWQWLARERRRIEHRRRGFGEP